MMKTKKLYVYECTFRNDYNSHLVRVVASSFGQAASIAHSVASIRQFDDSYDLHDISMQYSVTSIS